MRSLPIEAAEPRSGEMMLTLAPRARRAEASSSIVARQAARRGAFQGPWRLVIVATIRTRTSRLAGAMSALVGLQTAPSTYSRPAMVAGANTSGSAQDALSACATVASGPPGAPKTTRLPERRSTATTRKRPSKRRRLGGNASAKLGGGDAPGAARNPNVAARTASAGLLPILSPSCANGPVIAIAELAAQSGRRG